MQSEFNRRRVIRAATGLALTSSIGALIVPVGLVSPVEAQGEERQTKMEDVTPPEDLMREHGVVNRILLIYGDMIGKHYRKETFEVSIISKSAMIIREFIEDYHERNEENQVFPRFKRAGKMLDLVSVLYDQHQAGRRLTDAVLHLAPTSSAPGDDRNRLIQSLQAFIRMYRPHEAREDTVLFPALRSVVSPNEFDAMGEDFEKDERQKFGEDGFEKIVEQVADLERALDIYDLKKFTPAG
jgi:hemerythrin-like domain-containing protein